MKKIFNIFLLLSAFCLGAIAQTPQTPAFPGAEGFARYTTTGGKGGKIVHVTNLNDSGTGSLRAAVNGSTKKIVVFDVSGIIGLKSNLNIGDNTTIEGQTAPGEGITVRYYTMGVGNNCIVRFIRFRRGQERDVNDGADAATTRNKNNIIFDHCSFSWSIDEVASFYDNKNFTMQWCTIGEALNNAGHGKGAHGYGGIWGGKGASFHHNLLIHLNNRVPRFNGARYDWQGYDKTKYANTVMAERVDFRNCVMYNWGSGGCYGGPGGGFINMVNNYYKAGPATTNKNRVTQCTLGASGNSEGYPQYWGLYSRYYINGNYVNGFGENYDWKGVITDDGTKYCTDKGGYYGEGENAKVSIVLDAPIEAGEVTTHTAKDAYMNVVYYAGASLMKDMVDTRYEEEVLTGTATYTGSVTKKKGLLDVVADQGSYTVESETRPANFDTDKDGMSDAWELANGLDPKNAADANGYDLDAKKHIYTNVEVYLNSLVQDIVLLGNADAETSVKEYFPAFKYEDGTPVAAIGEDVFPDYTEPDVPVAGGDATITWPLSDAANVSAFTVTDNLTSCLKSANVDLSSFFTWYTVRTQGTGKLIEVGPSGKDTGGNPDHAVTFSYEIKDGEALFEPKTAEFYISKNGTDGGSFDVAWKDAGGTTTTLASGVDMIRNTVAPNYLAYSVALSGVAPSKKGALVIMPYNIDGLASNPKKFGLGNVRISGTVSGGSSGISNVADRQDVSIDYFNMQGLKVNRDAKGVVLKVVRMADGTKRVVKVLQ